MATSTPNKLAIWVKTKSRYHLTDVQIQMARELGLNPKKFGGLDNTGQESWRKILSEFIEALYFKRFGKKQPYVIKSLDNNSAILAQILRKTLAHKSQVDYN